MSWLVGMIGYATIVAIAYYGVLFMQVKAERYTAGYRLGLLFTLLFALSGADYVLAMFRQDTEATFWQRVVYMTFIFISLCVSLYFKRRDEYRLYMRGGSLNDLIR